MTIQLSTALRTRLLGPEAIEDILDSCEMRIFSGSQPSTADRAQAGTLLGKVSLRGQTNSPLKLQRSSYTLTKPALDIWLLSCVTAGLAGWFRLCLIDDSGGASYGDPRIDGAITLATASEPGEMVMKTTTLQAGVAYSIDSFLFGLPPLGVST